MSQPLCRGCDQPMLRAGQKRKHPDDYRHASGCPLDKPAAPLRSFIVTRITESVELFHVYGADRRDAYNRFQLGLTIKGKVRTDIENAPVCLSSLRDHERVIVTELPK